MPNLKQKKEIVGEFLSFLSASRAFKGREDFSVVRLLVGYPNIIEEMARECAINANNSFVQGLDIQTGNGFLAGWAVTGTEHGLPGDIMISSGVIATEHIICRGKNYADKGFGKTIMMQSVTSCGFPVGRRQGALLRLPGAAALLSLPAILPARGRMMRNHLLGIGKCRADLLSRMRRTRRRQSGWTKSFDRNI